MKREARFDPREAPAYRMGEAAHYLGLSASTLRAWTVGQLYLLRRDAKPIRVRTR
jgi:hypothetical protein